jgi:uncharacterized HAD superfamily protein
MKTILCDLDGTLCTEEKTFSRALAKPLTRQIELLNKLAENHKIIIFTARSWAEYDMTEAWLNNHGVCFDQLICGKPIADIVIDDRSFTSVGAFY